MAETGRGKEDRAPEKEGNRKRFGPRVRAKDYQMVASQQELDDSAGQSYAEDDSVDHDKYAP